MSVIIVLLVASVSVALVFLGAFIWSVKGGQFDDDYSPPRRMLFDEFGSAVPPNRDPMLFDDFGSAVPRDRDPMLFDDFDLDLDSQQTNPRNIDSCK